MSRLSYKDSSALHLGGHTASGRIRASNSCVQMWCSVAVASGSGRESFAVALAGTKRERRVQQPATLAAVSESDAPCLRSCFSQFLLILGGPDAAINMQCSSKTP